MWRSTPLVVLAYLGLMGCLEEKRGLLAPVATSAIADAPVTDSLNPPPGPSLPERPVTLCADGSSEWRERQELHSSPGALRPSMAHLPGGTAAVSVVDYDGLWLFHIIPGKGVQGQQLDDAGYSGATATLWDATAGRLDVFAFSLERGTLRRFSGRPGDQDFEREDVPGFGLPGALSGVRTTAGLTVAGESGPGNRREVDVATQRDGGWITLPIGGCGHEPRLATVGDDVILSYLARTESCKGDGEQVAIFRLGEPSSSERFKVGPVAIQAGRGGGVEVASDGRVYVLFEPSAGALTLASREPGAGVWDATTLIPTGGLVTGHSFGLDGADLLHMAYFDRERERLESALVEGSRLVARREIVTGSGVHPVALEVEEGGAAHLIWARATGTGYVLEYAFRCPAGP